MNSWILPWLHLSPAIASSALMNVSNSTVENQKATGYTLRPLSLTGTKTPGSSASLYDSTFTLWMSAEGIPLRIDYSIPANDNPFALQPCSRVFKDYRVEKGMMVPHTEEQYLGSQLIARVTLDQVNLADTVSNSYFSMPPAEVKK